MRRSIFTSFVWPVPLILIGVGVVLFATIDGSLREQTERDVVESNVELLDDLRRFRTYYAESVVRKAKAGGIATATDHAGREDAIPYPATFLHELGAMVSSGGRTISMYSPYPFDGRADRVLDDRQLETWEALIADPDAPFVRMAMEDGQPVMVVAVADRMASRSCVECHNAHPGSQKRNWELGDVRAVFAATVPLAGANAHRDAIRNKMTAIMAVTLAVALLLYLLLIRRSDARMQRAIQVLDRVVAGETDVDVPARTHGDEADSIYAAIEGTIGETTTRNLGLQERNRRFDAALNNMPHGLCMFDKDQRMIVCNARYADMYQLTEDLKSGGATLAQIFAHRGSIGSQALEQDLLKDRLAGILRGEPSEFRVTLADGRTIQISHQPLEEGGWVATHQDVSESVEAQARISYLAAHDALTGLPNRVLLRDRMDEALKRVRRGHPIAVHCLDLDNFKSVNDTLGHPVGDALLKQAAERVRGCLRETDTVARLGGDEFAVIQMDGEMPEAATVLATRLIGAMSAPFEIDGHQVVVGTSIGIAVSPGDGDDPDVLLKNADMALYRAKADGRGVHRFFEPEMDAKMRARRLLELDLRKALAAQEFELFYQPSMDLRTGTVSGLEALLRWRHPERGLVSPGEFIPLAEEIGLIIPIGAWVLKRACADAAAWPEDIRVAVNLSPVQFKSADLYRDVVSAVEAAGLCPGRLELEITESVMLQETESTLRTLNRLKAFGVRIAMDDFGTGYSSLSYLRKFPFDKIKIDQSFIRDMDGSADSAAIVRAVTGLGASLGMMTTAEGVETSEQLRWVTEEGCTEVQGFLFSAPIPNAGIPDLLASLRNPAKAA